MIYFGVPEFTSDNDHDVRCVKMAMEMQEKMEITFVQSVRSAQRGQRIFASFPPRLSADENFRRHFA